VQTKEQKTGAEQSAAPRTSEKNAIGSATDRQHRQTESVQENPPQQDSPQQNPPLLKKQIKPLTPQQQAENDARKALLLVQQGQMSAAISLLDQVLQQAPDNADARQTLIAALLRTGKTDQAMVRAQEGLTLDIKQTGFAMILARLQVEKGQQKTAIATLQRSLPYAEEQPEYPAFLAALLQREKRHKEAIAQYLQALRNAPDNGVWWMGLGISLQAEKRDAEARQAFTRAHESASLTPDLQAFVEQRLKQLAP
jgi:MSHA biogenesis protein MshN